MSEKNEEKGQPPPQDPRLEELQRAEEQELSEKDAENVRGGMVSGKLTNDWK